MKLHPRVSRRAMDLVMAFEGYRAEAARLPGGGWTIGYGHTRSARQGAHVSRADAELLLRYDLSEVARALEAWVFAPLNPNQFDALVALGFNIGVSNLRRSTALKRLNEGNYLQAAAALEQWRRAKLGNERLVVDALVRRRAAEKALFLTPPEGFPRAPSPVVRPEFDPEPQLRVSGPLTKPEPDSAPSNEEAKSELVAEPPRQTWEAAARIAARLRALAPDREPSTEPERQSREPDAPAGDAEVEAQDDPFETAEIERPAEEAEPPPPFAAEPPPPPPFTRTRSSRGASGTSSTPADETLSALGETALTEPSPLELETEGETPVPPPPPALAATASAEPRLTQPDSEIVPSDDNRRAAAPLALVGLVCFLGALVSIVQGRPEALNLLFGIGGVVLMAAGYFIWTSVREEAE